MLLFLGGDGGAANAGGAFGGGFGGFRLASFIFGTVFFEKWHGFWYYLYFKVVMRGFEWILVCYRERCSTSIANEV